MTRFLSFLSNWRNLLPLLIVGCFAYVAITAPLLSPPNDPKNPTPFRLIKSSSHDSLPPNMDALLGTAVDRMDTDTTTILHYDIFHSLVWGTRAAFRFGLTVTLITACFGVLIGAVGGYAGGAINSLVLRVTDAFLTFPVIAGVWFFQTIMTSADLGIVYLGFAESLTLSPTPIQRLVLALGVDSMMLAFILFSWMPYTRIINANVLRLKQAEFVQAAQSIGAGPLRIILRHLLPNAIAPAIVMAARDIGGMVILQAAFTFVGLGSGPIGNAGIAEWARLLLLGRHWIIGYGGNSLVYWWLYVPVTLALLLFGIGWNMLGDRLNATFSPWQGN